MDRRQRRRRSASEGRGVRSPLFFDEACSRSRAGVAWRSTLSTDGGAFDSVQLAAAEGQSKKQQRNDACHSSHDRNKITGEGGRAKKKDEPDGLQRAARRPALELSRGPLSAGAAAAGQSARREAASKR